MTDEEDYEEDYEEAMASARGCARTEQRGDVDSFWWSAREEADTCAHTRGQLSFSVGFTLLLLLFDINLQLCGILVRRLFGCCGRCLHLLGELLVLLSLGFGPSFGLMVGNCNGRWPSPVRH